MQTLSIGDLKAANNIPALGKCCIVTYPIFVHGVHFFVALVDLAHHLTLLLNRRQLGSIDHTRRHLLRDARSRGLELLLMATCRWLLVAEYWQ